MDGHPLLQSIDQGELFKLRHEWIISHMKYEQQETRVLNCQCSYVTGSLIDVLCLRFQPLTGRTAPVHKIREGSLSGDYLFRHVLRLTRSIIS
jgi:hypothetical protein